MTTETVKTASYAELRTFAKDNGLKLKSPTTDVLRAAVATYLAATPVEPAVTQPAKSTKSHRNLGYEAKVALRVARFHPEAPEEAVLRADVAERFRLFKEVRKDMKVEGEHFGETECTVCGKHHIHDIFDVRLADGTVIPLGDDCIENIGYITGDGFFKARRDNAYKARVEGAISNGSISKEELRRYRIRLAKGWQPATLPEDLQ